MTEATTLPFLDSMERDSAPDHLTSGTYIVWELWQNVVPLSQLYKQPIPDLVWLGHSACDDVSMVGGKVASLSRLAAAYRVPPGFCVTTAVLDQWGEGTAPETPRRHVR